jgi:hypothetical protein
MVRQSVPGRELISLQFHRRGFKERLRAYPNNQ